MEGPAVVEVYGFVGAGAEGVVGGWVEGGGKVEEETIVGGMGRGGGV